MTVFTNSISESTSSNGITVNNATTFSALSTHSSGVALSGGSISDVSPAGVFADTSNRINFVANSERVLRLSNTQFSRDYDEMSGLSGQNLSQAFDVRGCPLSDSVVGLNVNFFSTGNPTSKQHTDISGVSVQDMSGADVTGILSSFVSGVSASDVGTGGGNAFSFLSVSDAPVHFSGESRLFAYNTSPYNSDGPAGRSLPGMIVRPAESTPVDIYGAASDSSAVVNIMRATSQAGHKFFEFKTGASTVTATIKGKIDLDATGVLRFNTSSDYRLKENFGEIDDSIDRVKSLNPLRFNYIDYPGITVDGFLAHEVQPIVPTAISGEKDGLDEDGNPEYQTIDHTRLIPVLTKALQEALTEIDGLKARLDAAGV